MFLISFTFLSEAQRIVSNGDASPSTSFEIVQYLPNSVVENSVTISIPVKIDTTRSADFLRIQLYDLNNASSIWEDPLNQSDLPVIANIYVFSGTVTVTIPFGAINNFSAATLSDDVTVGVIVKSVNGKYAPYVLPSYTITFKKCVVEKPELPVFVVKNNNPCLFREYKATSKFTRTVMGKI